MKTTVVLILLAGMSFAWELVQNFDSETTGGDVTAIAFSSDSTIVVEGNSDGQIRSFAVSSGELQNELILNSSGIKDIKTSPSGESYAVCAEEGIYLINSSSLSILNQAPFPDGECSDIQWFPNGTAFSVVGQQTNLSQYVIFNSNLTVAQQFEVQLREGQQIYDSSISSNGRYITLTGSGQEGNTTTSNVLVYQLANGQFVGAIDVPTNLMSNKKRIEFNPTGNQIAILYEGTNIIQVHTLNNNNQFIREKNLEFSSNVVDLQYSSVGSLLVLRQNGTSSVIDFVSVSDSNGRSISSVDQIVADKGEPTRLRISPNGKNVAVSFRDNGLQIYSNDESSDVYVPVIAAVVGAVVAGSVGAVVASTAPAALSAVPGTIAPNGLIGISEVQQVGMKVVQESGKGIL